MSLIKGCRTVLYPYTFTSSLLINAASIFDDNEECEPGGRLPKIQFMAQIFLEFDNNMENKSK